jgi:folate-binding protein YgfZ
MMPTPLSDSSRAAVDALHAGAVALARPELQHMEFLGPKAGDVLTGLVTNDVLALAPGEAQYAAALTPKGKMLADLRIVRVDAERFITTTRLPAGSAWSDLVRKYVNPRLAKYAVLPLTTVSVLGPAAAEVLDTFPAAEGELRLPTDTYDGLPGFDLLVAPERVEALLDAVTADARVTVGTAEALDVVRIAAGRPWCGVDMDDTTIPQEANLGDFGALSFTKGCYTGQETVARLHFRGHVNKSLRRLSAASALPRGAELRLEDGKVVGDVRSTAISPTDGPIGLGMVRREVAAGARVLAHADGAPPVEVVVLS